MIDLIKALRKREPQPEHPPKVPVRTSTETLELLAALSLGVVLALLFAAMRWRWVLPLVFLVACQPEAVEYTGPRATPEQEACLDSGGYWIRLTPPDGGVRREYCHRSGGWLVIERD